MKKVFVLFTVVMLMAVMAWEKQSGKPVESEFLLDNVEALAAAMNMSRSSLHRKIKALTDLSSLDFIRIIRLKHAAELLQEGELRINEICDRVGFQSPSYFAKVFQKQFGVTPTEFVQQNKQRMADSY